MASVARIRTDDHDRGEILRPTAGSANFSPVDARCTIEQADQCLMIEPFTMPSPIARAVLEHLVAAMPNEGVGLIAVKPGFDRLACEFYPGTNTDRSPHRFTMDPAEVLAALRAMAARGWRLGAIVHSHPSSEPEPSETDLKEAYYDDVVTLIAGLAPRRPIFRGWRIRRRAGQSTVIEIPIVIGTEYG